MNLRLETPKSILQKYFEEKAAQESLPCPLGKKVRPEGEDDLPASRGPGGDPFARWETLISLTRGVDPMAMKILMAQHMLWVAHEVVILAGDEDDIQAYDLVAVPPTDAQIAHAAGLTPQEVKSLKMDALAQVALNLQRMRNGGATG